MKIIKISVFSCNETEQFKIYSDLNKELSQADENEVFKITGCLSTCDKYEYLIQPETTLIKKSGSLSFNGGRNNQLFLKFYYPSGRHTVKEQVTFPFPMSFFEIYIVTQCHH